MKLLLDTHTLLWAMGKSSELRKKVVSALEDPQKEDHKDPFDRMLIYQCIRNDYTFVSKDENCKKYLEDGLKYLW